MIHNFEIMQGYIVFALKPFCNEAQQGLNCPAHALEWPLEAP